VSTHDAAVGPPLREIGGPSAFGGGTRRFFHLLWVIASTDFRLTYFGSALGYLWSLMRPLLLFGVLYVVFSEIVKFGDDIENYPVLLLFNIVLFSFFTEATQNCVTCVVNRESLVRKMHFPRLVIPLATTLTSVLNLAVNLIAVLVFLLVYGVDPEPTWLLLPALLVLLTLFTAAVGVTLSVLYVKFRDVQPIWMVVSTMLFYGTPVLYSIEFVPEGYRELVLANPVASLLELGRVWIVDPSAPTPAEVAGSSLFWLVPAGIVLAVVVIGLWLFNREAPRIAEEL
jgi:ABC-2 type transport system permease protein